MSLVHTIDYLTLFSRVITLFALETKPIFDVWSEIFFMNYYYTFFSILHFLQQSFIAIYMYK